jgi:hypothetical protein
MNYVRWRLSIAGRSPRKKLKWSPDVKLVVLHRLSATESDYLSQPEELLLPRSY